MEEKNELRGFERRYLLELAHELKPVVMIGRNGCTDQVVKAVDEALDIHELIKVKFQGFKEEKQDLTRELAHGTGAVPVRIIGNIAILYRESREPEKRRIRIPGGHFRS